MACPASESASLDAVGRERKRVPVMGDHLVPKSKRVAVVGGGLVGFGSVSFDGLFW